MVPRNPLGGDATIDAHQAKAAHIPSKTVVKETQREVNPPDTPSQSTNEGQTLNRAQDVAELKDYVRISASGTKPLISNLILATW